MYPNPPGLHSDYPWSEDWAVSGLGSGSAAFGSSRGLETVGRCEMRTGASRTSRRAAAVLGCGIERPATRSRRARDADVFASVHDGQRQPLL